MNKHHEAAKDNAVKLLECLTDALAWYYDEFHHDPSSGDDPYWPTEGRELIGRILRPDAHKERQLVAADDVIFRFLSETTP